MAVLVATETLTVPGMGSVTTTAADGDQLSFDYEGTFFALTGEGIGTFTFTGGTGRFANGHRRRNVLRPDRAQPRLKTRR